MLLDDPAKPLRPSLSFTTLGNSSQDTLAWQHVLLDRAAASALTLVSPVAPDEATAALVFSHDSLFNSTVSLRGDDLYRIRSDGRGIETRVFRRQSKLDDELLCTYDRRLLGSVLKWPGKETIRVGKYIRPSKSRPEGCVGLCVARPSLTILPSFARARHAAKFDHEGETYEWRIDIMGKMAVRPFPCTAPHIPLMSFCSATSKVHPCSTPSRGTTARSGRSRARARSSAPPRCA
jgi:hypothetical protein